MSKVQLQYSTPSSSKLSIKKEDETNNNNDTLPAGDLLPREDPALEVANEDEEAESSKFQDYYGIVVESRQDMSYPE